MNEKELRNESYKTNSDKEDLEREFFDKFITKYFHITKWIHHPEDSWYNKAGADITAWFGSIRRRIDLKGYDDKYNTVALSYARSYDNIKWRDTMLGRITDDFIFVDPEAETSYILTKSMWEEIRNTPEVWNSLERREVPPSRGGHYNRVVLIPKSMLYKVELNIQLDIEGE